MRVTCPNCAAGYEVPDHLLAAGPRTLRCARCATTFAAEAPEPAIVVVEPQPTIPPPKLAAIAAPEAVVFHPPMLPPPRAAPGAVGAVFGIVGWIVTLIVLAGTGLVLVRDRAEVVAAWPPIARAYAAIGLSPPAAPAGRAPLPDAPPTGPATAAGPSQP